ncbi:MAG: nitrous oxide reductase accessory protein NosL [Oligoflexia bacterium]|nr:nitrous oxide reductase accessory protein NosL [Oligoflexia bacterium]
MTGIEKRLLLASLLLLSSCFLLPLWRIEIFAPQYPEGLFMQISLSRISGNVDQINILNHYIGMKPIHAASIPELELMPKILAALIALGALAAALGRRAGATLWTALLVLTAGAGLADFFRWGHDYGHNLDPDAPIKIPGMSYQPPLIGHKLLLNIHSYSLPDLGGIALSLAILLALLSVSWRRPSFQNLRRRFGIGLALALGFCAAAGCTAKPQPLQPNVDSCQHCHMTISDIRFGGEIITRKGKIHKFDSLSCLLRYRAESNADIRSLWVSDYLKPGSLIEAGSARFLRSERVQAPMGDGLLASADAEGLRKLQTAIGGEILDWNQLLAMPPGTTPRSK